VDRPWPSARRLVHEAHGENWQRDLLDEARRGTLTGLSNRSKNKLLI
jgi:hypothetical protein